jgi:hypothetical protein
MRRFFARLVPVPVLLLVLSGCGGSDDTPMEPAPPTQIVETFPSEGLGILTPNGAFSYPFTVIVAGFIEARLVDLKPADESFPQESAVPVGLSLGTWNGSICDVLRAIDVAKQGDVVDANSTSPGAFCVRIYDAQGTLPRPQAYRIVLTHS